MKEIFTHNNLTPSETFVITDRCMEYVIINLIVRFRSEESYLSRKLHAQGSDMIYLILMRCHGNVKPTKLELIF